MSASSGFAVLPVPILASILASMMWMGGLAGCYAPRALPEGAPCERSEQCPQSQQCVLGSCSSHEPPPTDAPAPPSDARTDAPVDAMPLACSTSGLSCTGTATMFMCGVNCWVRCSASVVRETARSACAGWMGALGEIDNQTEQDCVNMHLGGTTLWVGMIQSNDPANTPDTGWTWNGIHPVTYTHWAAGQPDDGGGGEQGREQCVTLRTDGTWADDPCTNPRGFFCERP
jgi:hypothetical protein